MTNTTTGTPNAETSQTHKVIHSCFIAGVFFTLTVTKHSSMETLALLMLPALAFMWGLKVFCEFQTINSWKQALWYLPCPTLVAIGRIFELGAFR